MRGEYTTALHDDEADDDELQAGDLIKALFRIKLLPNAFDDGGEKEKEGKEEQRTV